MADMAEGGRLRKRYAQKNIGRPLEEGIELLSALTFGSLACRSREPRGEDNRFNRLQS